MPTSTTNPELDLNRLLARGERVFSSVPQVARYFAATAIDDARRRLCRTIERGDGPGIAIGGAGTGKSLLLQVLAAQYHEKFDVVLLACARICTRRALLQTILFELGLPHRLRDEGELRLSLLDHLLSADNSPAGLLLLVDEAQTLSVALLDELRVMTNLVRSGSPRVRLVLAGLPALEESFAHPDLESFSQRLSARCYLAPFNREETRQFIRAQVAACGGAPDAIFSAETATAVFDATDGVPRLVNQLCDRALWIAQQKSSATIDRGVIQAAWADLQQLPAPWDNPAPANAAPTRQVVEFGGLLDDPPLASAESDIEPTELDLEIDEVVAALPLEKPEPVVRRPSEARRRPDPADPFAEKFDEEEVVLDNFAAWDDMFTRTTPRVENRRDPGFAARVQAVVDALPASQNIVVQPETLAVESEDVDDDLSIVAHDGLHDDQPQHNDSQAESLDWPPLRLAVVVEPAPLQPIPLIAPVDALQVKSSAFDPVLPEENDSAEFWQRESVTRRTSPWDAARGRDKLTAPAARDPEPILVIEDDSPHSPTGNSPVRREQYRHLFSRLRSG